MSYVRESIHSLWQQATEILFPSMLCESSIPRGGGDMTNDQFQREILYHASLAPFHQLLLEGYILPSDYAKIDTILVQKYRPIFVDIMPRN